MNILIESLRGLVHPLLTISVAMLIMIQQDPEGGLLINSFHGLGLAVFVLLTSAIVHCIVGIRALNDYDNQR